MDLYISDSMQDMLDIDIRSEVATVVGGVNEFTSLMNFDLPSLDLDTNSNDADTAWLGGPKWSTNDFYADVGACVNPNSVMPALSSQILASPKGLLNLNTNINACSTADSMSSPKEKKSHLTFSPNTIKVPVVQENKKPSAFIQAQKVASVNAIKKDLISDLKDDKLIKQQLSTNNLMSSANSNGGNTIKLAAGIGGLTFANSVAYTKLKQNNIKQTLQNTNISILQKRERASSPQQQQQYTQIISNSTNHHNQQQNSPSSYQHVTQKIFTQNRLVNSSNNKNNSINNGHIYTTVNSPNNNNLNNKNSSPKIVGQEFPKPAYSYSCLIAMALKNSRAGSLPVSEIYSFMCEHFPYFKTAPNGWKNSVRHNLSLNKCFEKIEKPATNGGQRKGCLWAMNPTKITKMDEEVQKWSRKDPLAIRKAMVYPEHLEALERGEMKHGSSGDSEGETESHSEAEQSDSDENDLDENALRVPADSCDDEEPEVEPDYDVEVSFFFIIFCIEFSSD